ncbi:hypothetical protein AC579_681 [Pseudocercospora musae]|uniref:peptidyl-tRNA hydrolase n=1 Tax=Pseudocercospora musae TaxID=113226 RepID=A0A139IDH0_9PEZI|nr:hypothetical protein AC579_681 [Pseudocercospora musae]
MVPFASASDQSVSQSRGRSDTRPPRHPPSDLRHPTSDIRHPTSDIRRPTSDEPHRDFLSSLADALRSRNNSREAGADMAHQSAYERVPPGAAAYALSAAIISFSLGYLAGQGRAIGLFGASRAGSTWTSEKSQAAGTDDDDDDDDASSHGSASEDDELQSFARSTEECKLVLVVRSDLGMTKGKIAAQCGHATLACYKTLLHAHPTHNILKQWESLGQAKVALKVDSEHEMLVLHAQALSLGLCAKIIHDAGRTQIASGSATVLGIGPAPKSKIDQVTAHLKLL